MVAVISLCMNHSSALEILANILTTESDDNMLLLFCSQLFPSPAHTSSLTFPSFATTSLLRTPDEAKYIFTEFTEKESNT